MPQDNNAFSFDIPAAVASAGAQIMEAEPEPQQHAIDQSIAEQASSTGSDSSAPAASVPNPPASAPASDKVDSAGTVFDPSKHTGSKLKDGTWRLKKAAKSASASVVGKPGTSATTGNSGDVEAAAHASAVVTNQLIEGMCRGLIDGDEWLQTEAERKYQEGVWKAYYIAKGAVDLPPGLLVCVALLSYAGPRLRAPKTSEKVGRIRKWIGLRYGAWKLRRELKKRGIDAKVTIKDDEILANGKPV